MDHPLISLGGMVISGGVNIYPAEIEDGAHLGEEAVRAIRPTRLLAGAMPACITGSPMTRP